MTSGRRGYQQACHVASALDLLGERWTLLIVRELLIGPRRFRDLVEALGGIGTNLLSDRLKRLAEEGLVARRKLPPPASVPVYELTEAGAALEPVLWELVRWGVKTGRDLPSDASYRPTWLVVAMRSLFRPERAEGLDLRLEFRVGEDVFHAVVEGSALVTGLGTIERPDVVVTAAPEIFRRYENGERPEVLAKTGKWKLDGSKRALMRFEKLFAVKASL